MKTTHVLQHLLGAVLAASLAVAAPAVENPDSPIAPVLAEGVEDELRHVTDELAKEYRELLARYEQDPHDETARKIRDLEASLRQELENASQALREREQQLNQRTAAYNQRVQQIQAWVEERNQLASSVDAAAAEARVDNLNARIEELAQELASLFQPLEEQFQQAQQVADELNRLVAAIESKQHPPVAEAESLIAEYNTWATEQAEEEKRAVDAYNVQVEEHERWLADEQQGLESREHEINVQIENLNDAIRRYNFAVEDYQAAYAQYQAFYQEHDLGDGVFTEDDAAVVRQLALRANHLANFASELNAGVGDAERRVEAEKQTYAQQLQQVRAEADARSQHLAAARSELEQWQQSAGEEASQRRAAVEEQVKALEHQARRSLEELRAAYDRIEASIHNAYGQNYAQIYEAVAAFFQGAGDAQATGVTLLQQGIGSPVADQALRLVNGISLLRTEAGAIIGQVEGIAAQVASLDARIDQESTGLVQEQAGLAEARRGFEQHAAEEAARLRQREEAVRKEIERLAQGLASDVEKLHQLQTLRLQLARLEGEFLKAAMRRDALHAAQVTESHEAVRAEVQALAHELADFLGSQTERWAAPSVLLTTLADTPSAFENDLRWQSPRTAETPSFQELAGDELRQVLHAWFHTLQQRGGWDDPVRILNADRPGDARRSSQILLALWINALERHGLVSRVTWASDEVPSYQIALRGKLYWVLEDGSLAEHDLHPVLFDYEFQTPESSSGGQVLRKQYEQLRGTFERALDTLSPGQQQAVVLAEALLREADRLNSEQEQLRLAQTASMLGQWALSATPLGDAVDLYELVYGISLTGEPLTDAERAFAGLSLLVGNRLIWEKVADGVVAAIDAGTSRLRAARRSVKYAWQRRQAGEAFDAARREAARLAPQVRKYSPLDPGPLATRPLGAETVASTFRSATYLEETAGEPLRLYRVYGGDSQRWGGFWTPVPPQSGTQAAIDLAVRASFKNQGTHLIEIEVPAGTKFFRGVAGPQGPMTGGGAQVYLDRTLDESWVQVIREGQLTGAP